MFFSSCARLYCLACAYWLCVQVRMHCCKNKHKRKAALFYCIEEVWSRIKAIGLFRYVKILTWLRGLGELKKPRSQVRILIYRTRSCLFLCAGVLDHSCYACARAYVVVKTRLNVFSIPPSWRACEGMKNSLFSQLMIKVHVPIIKTVTFVAYLEGNRL